MNNHSLYVEVTNKAGEESYRYHRVWNAKKFAASLQDQHRKEGSTVRVISEMEYIANTRRSK